MKLLAVSTLAIFLCVFGLLVEPENRLIWNRTASAPSGLYWLSDKTIETGDWVAVAPHSMHAAQARKLGLVGRNWPLIKRVAAGPGSEICRRGADIYIDGRYAARAISAAPGKPDLPSWQGCILLSPGEVFLLNQHPHSFDGRYVGASLQSELLGVAKPIWTFEPRAQFSEN